VRGASNWRGSVTTGALFDPVGFTRDRTLSGLALYFANMSETCAYVPFGFFSGKNLESNRRVTVSTPVDAASSAGQYFDVPRRIAFRDVTLDGIAFSGDPALANSGIAIKNVDEDGPRRPGGRLTPHLHPEGAGKDAGSQAVSGSSAPDRTSGQSGTGTRPTISFNAVSASSREGENPSACVARRMRCARTGTARSWMSSAMQ
jgi:hypothetical protein